MRAHGVVGTASGLIPFGHLGWAYGDRAEFRARAAEYLNDGLAQNQRVEFAGDGDAAALTEELASMPELSEAVRSGRVAAVPVTDFYEFVPGSDVVDPQASVAARVRATEEALAAGYTGLRAVVDATAVARTEPQRTAFSEFEFLIDQQMAELAVSALCAYDAGRLGDASAELTCLHPYIAEGAAPFQLYTEPGSGVTLRGELDDGGVLATVLDRLTTHKLLHDLRIDYVASDDGAEVEQLRDELRHREHQVATLPVIEEAKGMLMHDLGLDPGDAFQVLVRLSQDTNTKLRDVAALLVGELTGVATHQAARLAAAKLAELRHRLA